MKHALSIAVAILTVAAAAVVAQETTGAMQGHVADETGTPIAGAAVEANGPPGKVATTSDSKGGYRFPRLSPGTYTVAASFEGLPRVEAEKVRVILGEAVTVDFTLQRGTFEDEIQVYSDTVSIDFTESADRDQHPPVGDRLAAARPRLHRRGDLRRRRDAQLPGRRHHGRRRHRPREPLRHRRHRHHRSASGRLRRPHAGRVHGGGAGQVGRLHGGVRRRHRRRHQRGHPLREQRVPRLGLRRHREQRVERHRAAARSSATCATTTPRRAGHLRQGRRGRATTRASPSAVRSCATGCGSSPPTSRAFAPPNRTVDWLELPARHLPQDYRIDYATVNLTANIGGRLLLKAGVNISPYTLEGYLPDRDGRSGLPDQESWAPLGTEGERETYLARRRLGGQRQLRGQRPRRLSTTPTTRTTGIPIFDVIHNLLDVRASRGYLDRHPEIPRRGAARPGLAVATSWPIRSTTTTHLGAKGRRTRRHLVRHGRRRPRAQGRLPGRGDLQRHAAAAYNADRILYYWDRTYTTSEGESVRRRLRLSSGCSTSSTLGDVASRNDAVFVQDCLERAAQPDPQHRPPRRAGAAAQLRRHRARPGDRASAGATRLAPRLGFAWDVANDGTLEAVRQLRHLLRRHQVRHVARLVRRRQVGRLLLHLRRRPTPSSTTPPPAAPAATRSSSGRCARPARSSRRSTDVPTRPTRRPGRPIGYPLIDPDLKPMESWEAQLGVDHQLTPTIQLGARYVHKELVRTIEDVGVFDPGAGAGVYVIGNPGEGITDRRRRSALRPSRCASTTPSSSPSTGASPTTGRCAPTTP